MKIKKILSLNILFFGLILITQNFSYAKDYEYTNLDIQANVEIDSTINIIETLTTNFFKEKHGIARNIPLEYTVDNTKFAINIFNTKVKGNKFVTNRNDGNLEIRIGDANKTVIGKQVYPISYSAYGLIKNFSGLGYSELYWNIIGYDFDTNINSVKAEINLPKKTSFSNDDFLITVNGKENSIGSFAGKVDWSQGDKIIITYDKTLPANEGITLAIKFPNDYFEFDHNKQASLIKQINRKSQFKNQSSATKTLIYITGLLCLFFGIMYISKNWLNKKIKPAKIGKDFESKYPIIVQYNPPKGINPAEAGVLFNCRVDPIDLTSLFYQWVNDKLIKIDYETDITNSKKIKSVTLIKINDIPVGYPYYEKELFNNIFKDDKKSKTINENTDLSKTISLEGLEDFGLHKHRLHRRKNLSFGRILLSILFIILLILGFYYFKWLGFLFLILFAPLFCGIAFKQNNKIRFTEEGGKLAAHVIGYAKFIKDCDENQLRTFTKEDPSFIDKTLPYAVAFGMETEFLKKVTPLIKDIEQTRLNQYSTASFPVGDITCFMRNILSKVHPNRKNILTSSYSSPYLLGNSNKSNGKYNKSNGKYNKLDWNYDNIKGFKVGSIFSGGGKSFKKGGGGGGGGSKSR